MVETIGVVLAEVRDCSPQTAAQIATNVGLSESTVRRALSELERTGLVESEIYQLRARVFMPTEEAEI